MADGNLFVKSRKSSSKRGGGVTLNQHQSWWKRLKIVAEALQRSTGDVRQCLTWCHQVEILICLQTEQIHHLGDHFTMLPGEHHTGVDGIRGAEFLNDRRQLDGFRTSAKHDGHAGLGSHRQSTGGGILIAFHQAPTKASLAWSVISAKLNPAAEPA